MQHCVAETPWERRQRNKHNAWVRKTNAERYSQRCDFLHRMKASISCRHMHCQLQHSRLYIFVILRAAGSLGVQTLLTVFRRLVLCKQSSSLPQDLAERDRAQRAHTQVQRHIETR